MLNCYLNTCIFNRENFCMLEEVSINKKGMCSHCLPVDFDDSVIVAGKQAWLNKFRKNYKKVSEWLMDGAPKKGKGTEEKSDFLPKTCLYNRELACEYGKLTIEGVNMCEDCFVTEFDIEPLRELKRRIDKQEEALLRKRQPR